MIQELKLEPVKLHQYFRMSLRELEGTVLSTGPGGTERFVFCFFYVIHMPTSFRLAGGSRFAFSPAKILTQKQIHNCGFSALRTFTAGVSHCQSWNRQQQFTHTVNTQLVGLTFLCDNLAVGKQEVASRVVEEREEGHTPS